MKKKLRDKTITLQQMHYLFLFLENAQPKVLNWIDGNGMIMVVQVTDGIQITNKEKLSTRLFGNQLIKVTITPKSRLLWFETNSFYFSSN